MTNPASRLFVPNVSIYDLLHLRKSFTRKWLGLGPEVEEVEKQVKSICGLKYALGTNSATSGLHLALDGLKLKPRSKVIVPSLTFASTAYSVLYCGHEIVFADIKEQNLQLDLDKLDELITKTDASCVIPVHYGGHRVDMKNLQKICKNHNVKIIEDCAHTLPYNKNIEESYHVGSYSDACVFSFEEKKYFL